MLIETEIQRTPWPRRGFVGLIGLVSIFRSPLAQTWIRWVDWISVYAFDYVDEIRTTGSLATKTNASLMCSTSKNPSSKNAYKITL